MNKFLALAIIIFIGLGCNMLDSITGGASENLNSGNRGVTETTTESTPTPETEDDETAKVDMFDKKDLLSIGAGTILVKATLEYTPDRIGSWSAYGLIDENKKVGWSATKKTISDQSITFRLPAKTTFKTIGFNTAKVDTSKSGSFSNNPNTARIVRKKD